MRPMVLEFPGDRGAATVDTQYMLGDNLLVAPVFDANGEVDFYLSEGTWAHLLAGEQLTGPRWHHGRCGFDSLPLFVRPRSVLARGSVTDRPDYDHLDGLRLEVYDLADGDERQVRVGPATFLARRAMLSWSAGGRRT